MKIHNQKLNDARRNIADGRSALLSISKGKLDKSHFITTLFKIQTGWEFIQEVMWDNGNCPTGVEETLNEFNSQFKELKQSGWDKNLVDRFCDICSTVNGALDIYKDRVLRMR